MQSEVKNFIPKILFPNRLGANLGINIGL